MDSLELAEQEEGLVKADGKAAARAKRRGEPAPPARRPNPVLLNLSPLRYVLRTLQVWAMSCGIVVCHVCKCGFDRYVVFGKEQKEQDFFFFFFVAIAGVSSSPAGEYCLICQGLHCACGVQYFVQVVAVGHASCVVKDARRRVSVFF